jgi:hypothetical protein
MSAPFKEARSIDITLVHVKPKEAQVRKGGSHRVGNSQNDPLLSGSIPHGILLFFKPRSWCSDFGITGISA